MDHGNGTDTAHRLVDDYECSLGYRLLADALGLASIHSALRSNPVSVAAEEVRFARSLVRVTDTGLSSYQTARNQP